MNRIIEIKKSSVLSDVKVKVGTSAVEFAAREMEALGLRSKDAVENEKTAYAIIIMAVPIIIVASVLYTFAKAS